MMSRRRRLRTRTRRTRLMTRTRRTRRMRRACGSTERRRPAPAARRGPSSPRAGGPLSPPPQRSSALLVFCAGRPCASGRSLGPLPAAGQAGRQVGLPRRPSRRGRLTWAARLAPLCGASCATWWVISLVRGRPRQQPAFLKTRPNLRHEFSDVKCSVRSENSMYAGYGFCP